MKVRAEANVIALEGRKITFAVRAFDEKGLIGDGRHERFIVTDDRFMKKCTDKRKNGTECILCMECVKNCPKNAL